MGRIIGDSAYPPVTYPTSWNGLPIVGWCVYIGGNTPHPWTAAEIARLKSMPWCRYILPIFTRSNPTAAGVSAAADAAKAVAWAKTYGQPRGTLTMWDYETAVDSAYELAVDAALKAAGLSEILYGSKSSVVKNTRPSGGYDEAEWTGKDYAPADAADQFVDTGAYDLNDFSTTAPLWDLHPPITVAPAPTPQENDMPYLISVTPDPTKAAGNTNAGIFMVDGGVVTHVPETTPTAKSLEAKFGAPLVVSVDYYNALLASMALTVTANVNINDLASAVVAKIGSDLQKG